MLESPLEVSLGMAKLSHTSKTNNFGQPGPALLINVSEYQLLEQPSDQWCHVPQVLWFLPTHAADTFLHLRMVLAACGISLSGIINYRGLKISFDNGKPPLVLTI